MTNPFRWRSQRPRSAFASPNLIGALTGALTTAFVVVALAVPAAAHGAPNPRSMDTRILHDYNDDCGGHDLGDNCRGTHDLIALDLREAYDDELGDVVVFRLILDQGTAGATLRDVVSIKAGSATKSYEFRTSDDASFTGTFERVSGPHDLGDGTRFAVEGTVRLATLGVASGDRLSEFSVRAYRGATEGDLMPGTYRTALGTDGPEPASEQGDPTFFRAPSYRLKGPVQYASMQADRSSVQVPSGGEVLVSLDVRNLLNDQAQTVRLTASGAHARFHDPDGSTGYTDRYEADLPRRGSTVVHLAVQGPDGASGTLTVDLRTDLGGRTILVLPYGVGSATLPETTPTGGRGAPAGAWVALAAVGFALLGAVRWARG